MSAYRIQKATCQLVKEIVEQATGHLNAARQGRIDGSSWYEPGFGCSCLLRALKRWLKVTIRSSKKSLSAGLAAPLALFVAHPNYPPVHIAEHVRVQPVRGGVGVHADGEAGGVERGGVGGG